jgi:hypothetical protein
MVVLGSSAAIFGASIFFFGQPEEGLDGQIIVRDTGVHICHVF